MRVYCTSLQCSPKLNRRLKVVPSCMHLSKHHSSHSVLYKLFPCLVCHSITNTALFITLPHAPSGSQVWLAQQERWTHPYLAQTLVCANRRSAVLSQVITGNRSVCVCVCEHIGLVMYIHRTIARLEQSHWLVTGSFVISMTTRMAAILLNLK